MGARVARFALGPWPFFPGVVVVIAFVTLVVRAFARAAALSTDASSTFEVPSEWQKHLSSGMQP